MRKQRILNALLLAAVVAPAAYADETSVSPYIDSIKKKMEEHGVPSQEIQRSAENPEPYIKDQRQKMADEGQNVALPQGTQPYIDQQKSKIPSLNDPDTSAGYTDRGKARLGPETAGGAIEAVKEGKSELHMKRPGKISGGIGFKLATGMSHGFSANSSYQANNFKSVYGTGFVPDLTLVAEWKPFYSETYGSLGFVGMAGGSIYKANGLFSTALTQPDGTTPFSLRSQTHMTYIALPATIGVKYQFNLSHLIRPYALAGPTIIGMSENRDDGIGAKKALSKGVTTTAGAAILLDWISADHTWNLYQDEGVKHYYLTIEYTKLTTISSQVNVSYSGLLAGFAFDF